MTVIRVPLGERSYEINITPGVLDYCGENWPDEIAVLSNEAVAPLYANHLAKRLREQKPARHVLQFNAPAGEASKSIEWTSRAYDALAEGRFTRRGALVAVGGGVVGDWAGFVAATWMRGISFVQVPTTLLAMVDSSVGGKTGINHPRAKNLIGAFHQPSEVIIDPLCLKTLPLREVRAGLAEVIKYGVIADAGFFAWLEENIDGALALDMPVLERIIARSCEIKAEVVGEDERESDSIGRRAILNYGHTAGHAFEAITSYGELLHGEAIAIGMTVAARLAKILGTLPESEANELLHRQTRLFERAGLPTSVPAGAQEEEIFAAMALDKKSRGASLNFILPTRLGHVERFTDVPHEAVREALQL
jgi:3-dehydroquinate synthase